jgi:DNA polymerase/3'-5' exonuclease PolX
MSAGDRIDLYSARVMAAHVLDLLSLSCERIAVAGSVRRERPDIGDIEIVVAPLFELEPEGLWGEPATIDRLASRLGELAFEGLLLPRLVTVTRKDGSVESQQRVGHRYQALAYRGFPVDLFIVRPPASFGVIFTIRTGPADWSQRLVTDCQRRFNRVENGQLLHFGKPVDCPDERDFLLAIGQPWVEPADRAAARVTIG